MTLARLHAAWCLAFALWLALTPATAAQGPKFTVKIGGDKALDLDGSGVLDPTRRINFSSQGNFFVNITTLQNQPLHLSHFPQFMIDRQVVQPEQGEGRFESVNVPLKPLRGKARNGTMTIWSHNGVRVTQTMELHAARPSGPGQKRAMNTVLITYTVENKGANAQSVAVRVCMDTYVVTNDNCLFAAPTHPGKVLDGIALTGKTLPPYVQMLQNPDLQRPGFVSHLTLDLGERYEKADKVILSSLGAGFGEWEMPVMQAGGDSACSFYWPAKNLKPGEKRELAYAYGEGLAVKPESEGLFRMSVGGSFEPGKLFTVSAVVADPTAGQTLTLELPRGVKLMEGKDVQPVPHLADENEFSTVMWKARILEPGEHAIRVRSSTGLVQTKLVTVTAVK